MNCCNTTDPITLEDINENTKIIIQKKEGHECSYCISRESLDSMVENMKSTIMDFTISFSDGDDIVNIPISPEQLREIASSNVVKGILENAMNNKEENSNYLNEKVLMIPDVMSKLTLHICFLHNTFEKMKNINLKKKLDANIFIPTYENSVFGSLFTNEEITTLSDTPHPSDGIPMGDKLEIMCRDKGEICRSHDLAPLFLQYFKPILRMKGNKYNLAACLPPAKEFLKINR